MWLSQKAVGAEAKIQKEQKTAPTIKELEQGIANRLPRVEEFKFIEQEATKLGVRAYLFGGTAAGYAHYVKWDMQREKGDNRFQKDRFDYDYTNIYRSTQDLDIVIDGNPDQAQKLQQALQEKYPHLQGGKTAWEVRLLTQDMGDKQAILNNPDFMNQHTDSNSTGMIEITKPRNGEHVVRDVRDWNSKEPHFLKDVHDGMLHYYFSPLHETTKFAKEGRNPPILSAIRFLTKAFQYELKIRPEDLSSIKKIIQEFDPKEISKNAYVAKWIEKNGKKLIQNAVNIEYAKNTLDQLGLREKLQSIKGDVSTADSLAWWMNKEPLRSHPIGQGTGKAARELGLDIVAHETNNFLAYESITRAHTGDPNVLISRQNAPGEAAAYGDGFYTKTGKEGARGTGLTIRFHLDPNAKEGHDFTYAPAHDYVVVKNKSALKVISESLNIGPVEYFRMLSNSSQAGLASSDKGILEKLKRRIDAKSHALTDQETKEILKILHSEVQNSLNPERSTAIREWLSLPFAPDHPELLSALIEKKFVGVDNWLATYILSQSQWTRHPELVTKLIENGTANIAIAHYLLSQPHWKDHPELVETLLQKGTVDGEIAQYVLTQRHWQGHPEWVETLIQRGKLDEKLASTVLPMPHWKDHPEFVAKLIERGSTNTDFWLAQNTLSGTHWKEHPELVKALIKKGTVDQTIASHILSQPHWRDHPEWSNWLEELLERGNADVEIASWVLSHPDGIKYPKFVEKLFRDGKADKALAQYLLSQPHWRNRPEFVKKLLDRGIANFEIARHVLSQPHWEDHPEFVSKLIEIGNKEVDAAIANHVLSKPHWKNHPELVEKLIKKGTADAYITAFVLSESHWADHPELRRLAGDREPTVTALRAAFARGETVHVSPKSCVLQNLNDSLR
jgi:hypothetical protein